MMKFALVFSAVGVVATGTPDVPSPTILDDNEQSFNGTRLFSATYRPCLKDAHGRGYHQGVGNMSSAEYIFEAQLDGCYKIEEWHSGQDPACSSHLSNAVRLIVQYGEGQKANTWIDQSQNGGQWNTVGALKFLKGSTGHLTLTGSSRALLNGIWVSHTLAEALVEEVGQECRSGRCFWASDAFRLSWISNLSVACRVPEASQEAVAMGPPASQEAEVHESDAIVPMVVGVAGGATVCLVFVLLAVLVACHLSRKNKRAEPMTGIVCAGKVDTVANAKEDIHLSGSTATPLDIVCNDKEDVQAAVKNCVSESASATTPLEMGCIQKEGMEAAAKDYESSSTVTPTETADADMFDLVISEHTIISDLSDVTSCFQEYAIRTSAEI